MLSGLAFVFHSWNILTTDHLLNLLEMCLQVLPGATSTSSGRVASKFGAYVPSVHSFDPQAFNIPFTEASMIDPQTRVLLEESAHALAGSGRWAMVVCACTHVKGE